MQEYICANALAKLCQFDGKVVPPRWHKTQLAYGGHLHRTLSRKLLHLFAKAVGVYTTRKAALAFCKNSLFSALIFNGDTLNSLANSFNVFCSLSTSKATLALNEVTNLLLRPKTLPFFLRYKSIKTFIYTRWRN